MSVATSNLIGELPDFASILRKYNDVTERLKRSHETLAREVCRLRQELQSKNKELERRERLAALGEMAAGLAHEIRNPLGGIRLYASLLERDLADRPKQRDFVRRLETGVRSLENIVGDVLLFAGGSEARPRLAPLMEIIDSAVTLATPTVDARGVILFVDPGLCGVTVSCDPGQIGRALLNLLLNALDAVEDGGHVWVQNGPRRGASVEESDAMCHLRIEDDGPGIDPKNLSRLFNPFFTTKDTGTGLGLAIVHRIAESNGGFVTAGNRPEGGAVFTLSLPLAMDAAEKELTEGVV